MPIFQKTFDTQEEEFFWLSGEIQRLLDSGHAAWEIGILARDHKNLVKISDFLNKTNLPLNYEQSRNILELESIKQLLLICRFVFSLRPGRQPREDLLWSILSFEMFAIPTVDLWNFSQKAYQERQSWLEAMLKSEDLRFEQIAHFCLELARLAESLPAQRILDLIVGTQIIAEEVGGSYALPSQLQDFRSPFKDYFLNPRTSHKFQLDHLSGLNSLCTSTASHFLKDSFGLSEFLEYVDLRQKNGLKLLDNSSFNLNVNGLQLMTTHKAKGLEFETVFVINCTQNHWFGGRKSAKINLPTYLDAGPSKDNLDDYIRLFYVAVTRAKTNLYLTKPELQGDQKPLKTLPFLPQNWEKIYFSEDCKKEILEINLSSPKEPDYNQDQKHFLQQKLKNFQLSASNLLTFLDLKNSGPQVFIDKVLLKIPQAPSPSIAYGNSIHLAFKNYYNHWASEGQKPDKDFLINQFKSSLYLFGRGLSPEERSKLAERGPKELGRFFEELSHSWQKEALVEFNFRNQGINLEGSQLTGLADRLEFLEDEKQIRVIDYKTGKPLTAGMPAEDQRHALWKYKIQLLFYKILVENSIKFGKSYRVLESSIEFLRPGPDGKLVILNQLLTDSEAEDLKKIIKIVYFKIINLDFPDTSKYAPNSQGIQDFISDLLNQKI